MEPERWKRIESIFHAALEADEGERAAILEDSCAGDESLRREVESLLAHHKSAAAFIETPAFATSPPAQRADRPSSQTSATVSISAGTVIGQYRIVSEIGGGGMGVVYKAEDTKLGRLVALKFLPENLATDVQAMERFLREARAASALNHPNICTIYDIEEYAGRQFIAMEYLDGHTLRDHLLGRALEVDEITRLGIQIAEALAAAHSRRVVHRDIKPGNLAVTASGLVKVLDFGLAKLIAAEAGDAATQTITAPYTVSGTLPYMSPEQLRGREVDFRTDIYALGVVLYEMSTGRRPFTAEIMAQLIEDILHSPPTPPLELKRKLPTKLEEIILKCLEKDPEDRYQSAKEIAVDLRRMSAPSATSVRTVVRPGRQRARVAAYGWAAAAAVALLVLLVGWTVFRPALFQSSRSIAVLPFVDESKDASSQYVSDGITEGVIDKLSELPSVKIISRSSVFRFKGKEADAQVVGRELKVQSVLTGIIGRDGNGLAVSAELVNVADGTRIWGRQFRYSMSDLSRVQDDLATSVADKLHLGLKEGHETRLARQVTDNSEAYQLYLQARYYFNQRTEAGIRKSIELFQQATETDPNFALAYAGLADSYIISANLEILAPRESLPEAKAAAIKALVLDPQLGEAHSALGQVKSHYEYDLPGAQIEFTKGIKFNPNYANGRLFYAGGYLTPMGRHSEAIAEMKKALELDPLSLPLNNLMGNTFMWARDYNKAVQQFRSTVELDPTFPLTHYFFSGCLQAMGNSEQAIAEQQKGELLSGASLDEASAEAKEFRSALQAGGAKSYWQKNLELTLKGYAQAGTRYFPALSLAAAFARVGNKDKALEWLEKSYVEKDGNITLIKSTPDFDNLRDDPRFLNLVRRLGLPQ
jgi:eukaryotic-like serine/threonine-protein kinase